VEIVQVELAIKLKSAIDLLLSVERARLARPIPAKGGACEGEGGGLPGR